MFFQLVRHRREEEQKHTHTVRKRRRPALTERLWTHSHYGDDIILNNFTATNELMRSASSAPSLASPVRLHNPTAVPGWMEVEGLLHSQPKTAVASHQNVLNKLLRAWIQRAVRDEWTPTGATLSPHWDLEMELMHLHLSQSLEITPPSNTAVTGLTNSPESHALR